MTFTVIATFYDSRMYSGDATAKANGRSGLALPAFQLIMIFAMSIMKGDDFIYIIIIIHFGGSLILFLTFTMTEIYFNH